MNILFYILISILVITISVILICGVRESYKQKRIEKEKAREESDRNLKDVTAHVKEIYQAKLLYFDEALLSKTDHV